MYKGTRTRKAFDKMVELENSNEKYLVTENEQFEVYEQDIYNEQDKVHEIHLTIVNKSTEEEVYSVTPCRAFDYYGTYFIEESNDFVVKSSDVGDLYYEFSKNDITWSLKE